MNDTTQPNPDIRQLAWLDDWQLKDSGQDLRGKILRSAADQDVGKITEMYADMEAERIVALRLDDGRLINIDAVDIRDGEPVLLTDAARIPPAVEGLDRDSVTTEHVPVVVSYVEGGRRHLEFGKLRVRTRTSPSDATG